MEIGAMANVAEVAVTTLGGAEVEALMGQAGVQVVDVRAPVGFFGGHVPGSLNMPGELALQRGAHFAGAARVIFVCDDGSVSAAVAKAAAERGFSDVAVLAGGVDAWFEADRRVETVSDRGMQF